MGLRWWRLRLALRLPLRCVLCRGVGFLLVYEYGFSLDCTLNTLLYLALRVRERERERESDESVDGRCGRSRVRRAVGVCDW